MIRLALDALRLATSLLRPAPKRCDPKIIVPEVTTPEENFQCQKHRRIHVEFGEMMSAKIYYWFKPDDIMSLARAESREVPAMLICNMDTEFWMPGVFSDGGKHKKF